MWNTMRAWILMAGLTGLLVGLGYFFGGRGGAMIFFLISLGMNFVSYFYSDRIVIRMTGAQPLTEGQAPELHAMVGRLTQRAGIPMPKLYLMNESQPNAFATGRNPEHGVVAVTSGLLQILDRDEVEGVIAHEIGHIKNRDILIGAVAAAMAGAISMLASIAQWGAIFGGFGGNDEDDGGSLIGTLVMAFVAPIAAMIIQMAISRSREYLADETGARLAGNPNGLSDALLKLEAASGRVPMAVNPAASHMFIVNPLSADLMMRLFSTHPPIPDRVERLRKMTVQ
ncbi:MAG: zinc metalloprotease HtpX [Solirubrobacterales bacterium]